MCPGVDLYNNAYAHYSDEVYGQIRLETYGEDLGQTGWATTEESNEIPRSLELTPRSSVLEIGSGSGRYALQVAGITGCSLLGLDINAPGIHTANALAEARGLTERVRFQIADASRNLSLDGCSFDAAFSNDVLCHIPNRLAVLCELFRVLKPGGHFLFSDALVIGGAVSHQELATRSSIGFYLFSPPGENERLLQQAGFQLIRVTDTSENAGEIARRWRDARQKRREALLSMEGEKNFEGLQQFLSTAHTLTSERRLLRLLYLANKPV